MGTSLALTQRPSSQAPPECHRQAATHLLVEDGVGAGARRAHLAWPAALGPGEAHQEDGQGEEGQQGGCQQGGQDHHGQQQGAQRGVEGQQGAGRLPPLLLLRPRRDQHGERELELGEELHRSVAQQTQLGRG